MWRMKQLACGLHSRCVGSGGSGGSGCGDKFYLHALVGDKDVETINYFFASQRHFTGRELFTHWLAD